MSSTSRRRKFNLDGSDHMSCLPDPLLQHILFYVPLQDVITMSCLSKYWLHTWRTLPTFIFHFNHVRASADITLEELFNLVDDSLSALKECKGHVKDGMEWRIGNGLMISFWSDCWVPNCNRLCDIVVAPIPNELLNAKVSDLVTPSGDWDWQPFDYLLLDYARWRIAAIFPPSNGMGQDRVAWKYSKDGGFNVKTAYQSIVGVDTGTEDIFLRKVWCLRVPQRVKSFLWICGHNKLLTNVERVKRGMTDLSFCMRCNRSCEDSLHAIRDCPRVQNTWMRLVKPSFWPIFFGSDLHSWLKLNLYKNLGSANSNWGMNNAMDIFFTIIQRVHNYNSDFEALLDSSQQKPVQVSRVVRWIPPDEGLVKVNVDGAVSRVGEQSAACGGIICDDSGCYIVGFTRRLGSCSSNQAELWSVYMGLYTAWLYGFRRVAVEMDSLVALEMIKGTILDNHPCASLMGRIQEFHQRDWEVKVLHMYREGNKVADAMAHEAYHGGNSLSFVNTPSSKVVATLEADDLGLGTVKVVAG
ncbi:putative ribonuclease H protein [Senna tora]|uniref:Putative ribonuclease H protein n=1 Tax=Senna tora TaxID=362788 RepID=A0A834XGA8_9FABA|nr:putative ribonuclease H protein [Senna tora]